MSAAGAVATGLAIAQATRQSTAAAVEVAHLADLFGGGGLGGVAAILGGGLELRQRAGLPPMGRVLHVPAPGNVFLGVTGSAMPSPRLLRDPRFLTRVTRAAAPGLARLGSRAELPAFLLESERFTDALDLGPASLHRRIRAMRGPGVRVAQAMFGRSFFAVARSPQARTDLVRALRRSRLTAIELPIARRGARTCSPASPRRERPA